MINFIKNSLRELEHVVWPTPKETRTYMIYTVSIIVVMTIFLMILGYAFRMGLDQAKYTINPESRNALQNLQMQQAESNEEALKAMYEAQGLTAPTTTESQPTVTVENVEATSTEGSVEVTTDTSASGSAAQ